MSNSTRFTNPMPVHLFYSYSHKDEQLRDELEKHLMALKRQGIIMDWYDRDIRAGDEWSSEIDEHLTTADIILLLISADFLASDYCYSIELAHALQRQKDGSARVIPIILRPVDWSGTPFGKLQALPTNAQPITLWTNRDQAFENVAKGIRAMIEQPRHKASPPIAVIPTVTAPEPPVIPSSEAKALSSWAIILVPATAWLIGHVGSLLVTGTPMSPFVIIGTIGGVLCTILVMLLSVSLTNTMSMLRSAQLIRLALYFLLAGLLSGLVGLILWLFGCAGGGNTLLAQLFGCRETTTLIWKLTVALSSALALAGASAEMLVELLGTRFKNRARKELSNKT